MSEKVDHAEDDRLAWELGQHRGVELGLGRLDRDLLDRRFGELRQEGVT